MEKELTAAGTPPAPLALLALSPVCWHTYVHKIYVHVDNFQPCFHEKLFIYSKMDRFPIPPANKAKYFQIRLVRKHSLIKVHTIDLDFRQIFGIKLSRFPR